MAGVKGKTGNPGMPNPKKKNATTFTVAPGVEPKGRMMGFRPRQSLEVKIDAAVAASGLKLADWLEKAAIAYLEKSSQAEGNELEQGQLHEQAGGTQDAIATEPIGPASDTSVSEDTVGDTQPQGKGKRKRTSTKKPQPRG